MIFPSGFHFSQSSLQDYINCPRRFLLRYVKKLEWPAPITEPIEEREKHLNNGRSFHLLIQQYLAGLDPVRLENSIHDPDLKKWWNNFMLNHPLADKKGTFLTEQLFTTWVNTWPLDAKYDLLVLHPEQAMILDWKTNQYPPKPKSFLQAIQTQVYLYVLCQVWPSFYGHSTRPAYTQLSMKYWFANFPQETITIQYSEDLHHAFEERLKNLIQSISQSEESDFVATDDQRKCILCEYRSWCERGIYAGAWNEQAEEESTDLFDLLTAEFSEAWE